MFEEIGSFFRFPHRGALLVAPRRACALFLHVTRTSLCFLVLIFIYSPALGLSCGTRGPELPRVGSVNSSLKDKKVKVGPL